MAWPTDWPEQVRGVGCPLCTAHGTDDNGHGVRVLAGTHADVYVQRLDWTRGYAIAIWNGPHVAEPTDLSDQDTVAYWREVLRAGRAIERHYRPVKMNYQLLGNAVPHLHTHIVPRHATDPTPGQPLAFPTHNRKQDESSLQDQVEALKRLLAH